jgi:hypothetical protein
MKVRFRLMGATAALLTTGALLLPAAPAQARPSRGACSNLAAMYGLYVSNGQWYSAVQTAARYYGIGCGGD